MTCLKKTVHELTNFRKMKSEMFKREMLAIFQKNMENQEISEIAIFANSLIPGVFFPAGTLRLLLRKS